MINKDSDLQQMHSDYHYHYLTLNGHEICITDFIVSVEMTSLPVDLGLTKSLLLQLGSLQSSSLVSLTAQFLQHSG